MKRVIMGCSERVGNQTEKCGYVLLRLLGIATNYLAKGALVVSKPIAFALALGVVIVCDTWELVIYTGRRTIANLSMVFLLLQNTQYRESQAIQIKLDGLIRVIEGAHNPLLALEHLEQAELDSIKGGYRKLAENARTETKREKDSDVPKEQINKLAI